MSFSSDEIFVQLSQICGTSLSIGVEIVLSVVVVLHAFVKSNRQLHYDPAGTASCG